MKKVIYMTANINDETQSSLPAAFPYGGLRLNVRSVLAAHMQC